jgi:hypothetical protein
MTGTSKRPKSSIQEASEIFAYRVPAEGIRALASSSDLAKIDQVTVLSPKSLPALRKRRLKGYFSMDREFRVSGARSSPNQGTSDSAVVPATAFVPDARGRAILRGVEFSHADLVDAGGAYNLEQARQVLRGISRQAIDKKVKEGSILAVPGPSNRRAYPTFQFNADGSVVAGLKEVQEVLPTQNPWAVLNFLTNPQDALAGARPIDELRAGALPKVLAAAKGLGEQGG